MIITESEEFKKEFKKLCKKFPSLESDFQVLKMAITAEPNGDGTKHWNCITNNKNIAIYKIRLTCRSVKGDKFRVIYKYDKSKIEILFIEVYFKESKTNHDTERVKQYLDI